ncbi:MAG: aminoacyl-tRNA hydrolase [Bacillota bacterium]
MHLIVGLGNPKKEYFGSRHNLGFQVVEALAHRLDANPPRQKHRSLVAEVSYSGHNLVLAQPLTYMNRSGLAVHELVKNYRIDLEKLLIIYDDLDLPPGTIRLRKKGSGAGHRGVQSIINALGTEAFPRLRMGIGKPPPWMETADYVLQPLEPPDSELINEAKDRAVEAILAFVKNGLETAMNNYNQGLPSAE